MTSTLDHPVYTVRGMEAALDILGATNPTVTQDQIDRIFFCYAEPNRKYHGPDHISKTPDYAGLQDAVEMGSDHLPDGLTLEVLTREEASAIISIAGFLHDIIQKHVDGADDPDRVFPPIIRNFITQYISPSQGLTDDGKTVFYTTLQEAAKTDGVTRIIADIFGISEDDKVIHNKSGNELDSAIGGIKTFDEDNGLPIQPIVAITAAIAATYPFQSTTDPAPDGHMGVLANRLAQVDEQYGLNMGWPLINDIMKIAVECANRDIAPFYSDYFVDLAHGGLQIKMEEIKELRPGAGALNVQQLFANAGTKKSAPFLYETLSKGGGFANAEDVSPFVATRDEHGISTGETYPSQEEHNRRVNRVRENSIQTTHYFRAKKVGYGVAAALATLAGEPEAPVPGFVYGQIFEFEPENIAIPYPDKRHMEVYNALLVGRGKGEVSRYEIDRAPIAGVIYGAGGPDAISHLFEGIQDMTSMADPDQARVFLTEVAHAIGMENMEGIVRELQRVALHPSGGDYNLARRDALGQALEEIRREVERDTPSPTVTSPEIIGHSPSAGRDRPEGSPPL